MKFGGSFASFVLVRLAARKRGSERARDDLRRLTRDLRRLTRDLGHRDISYESNNIKNDGEFERIPKVAHRGVPRVIPTSM